ncbi:MAG: tetratricopeptide repeat protein [Williamsia sp.]|nr:tetratricopeptide repeat protein [Williamsia sp.]
MKKNSIYTILLVVFAATIVFIVLRYRKQQQQKEAAQYSLQERRGALANTAEWASTKSNARSLLAALEKNPSDSRSSLALAALFIQEARITGNFVYYDMAAMKWVNKVLATDSLNFNALILKSLLYLSQHHFADGLATAQRAQKINPYNAFVYGLIVDGYVEMGDYAAAVENADKMVSVRPDIRSYARVSYLREIHGDYPGAIEAMKMAVSAGAPGDEATEWARIQLARLYENTGQPKWAAMHYTIALNERPDYPYALAGMARLAVAEGDYAKAIAFYLHADSLMNDYSFKEELVDVYKLAGQPAKARALSDQIIGAMTKDAQAGQADESIGHYADRELALAYLKENNYQKAIDHALLEYNRRPGNIDANETVAWAYYSKGDYASALPYMKTALKTGSKNPVLLCHAGLLYAKSGDTATAAALLQEALKLNPLINEPLKREGTLVLKQIKKA